MYWILFRRIDSFTWRMRDHENTTDQCRIQVYIHLSTLASVKILRPDSTQLCPARRQKTLLHHNPNFLCKCWLGHPNNEVSGHILNLWCSSTCWPSLLVSSNGYPQKMASPPREESYTLHRDG